MCRLIKLFSLLFALLLLSSSEIKREFDLKVELVGTLREEKPKLQPPERLAYQGAKPLDLSNTLLEAPKTFEYAKIEPLPSPGFVGCGEPKDAQSYRLGVDYYLKKDYERAQEELKKVISMPSSFKPMAEYVLGVIYVQQGKLSPAMELFESSCRFSHVYSKPACESYYALSFKLKRSIPKNDDPLWKSVRALASSQYVPPSCEGATFSEYCGYIRDFYEGKLNEAYFVSSQLRRGIKLFFEGNLKDARDIFKKYEPPASPHREVALYYLGLIELAEGRLEKGLYYIGLMETINRVLAKSMYDLLASKGILYSRLAYTSTGDLTFVERAGILAYNEGRYDIALSNFLEAKNHIYAVYSAVKLGDYKTAYNILKKKKDKKTKEDYLWLLESAYWAGYDLREFLSQVRRDYPDIYREYVGWDHFRRGEWERAVEYLDEPYYKAVALYNAKRYQEVLKTLEGRTDTPSRVLKARSALFMGNPKLARSYLTQSSDEELYLLGLSYFTEGDYERAYKEFERVSEKSPHRSRALLKSGDALYNMGMLQKAKEKYYQVLKNYPDTEYARSATLALLGLGDKEIPPEEMERLIRTLLEKEPDAPYANELKYQLADIYLRGDRIQEARSLLLELLGTPLENRAVLKLAQLEEDLRRKTVLLYKVYKEGNQEERKRARDELVEVYKKVGDRESLAELLAEGEPKQKAEAMALYVQMENIQRAEVLAKELMGLGYRSMDFEGSLLSLFEKTKDRKYLEYVLSSPDADVRASALYVSALDYLERGDKRKALEDLVDIASNYRGSKVYNRAIIKGAEVLLSMNARRDASCLLDRHDPKSSTPEEARVIRSMKEKLPRCEVR